jgi:branched-chain amino acid transport system substrate-binding protein
MGRRLSIVTVLIGALALGTLAACSESLPEATTETTSSASQSQADEAAAAAEACGADLLACARDSTLAPYVPDEATGATGEPIRLGMVNQENTAAGSYPELSLAAQAAIDFVNEQLGGVDGRPIELEVCNTEFSAEGSTSCGQRFVERDVAAVLGGIDVFGNAVETLAENDIPYIGGIPISTQSVQSTNSFQWSGGTWGATVAFAEHAATELEAERVSIVYGEFGSITHSAEVGQSVLEDAGVAVQLVPYPIMATDISSALNAAEGSDPDAIFVLAADAGCKAGFDGLHALGTDVARFFVGACAAPPIVEAAGVDKTDGAIFNVEGPVGRENQPNEDFSLYAAVVDRYAEGLDPVGAGTVSFRAFANLYAILRQLDGDITPASITEALRAQVDAPSFMGHPYTCDGEQFPGLPAMCSPQQVLAEMQDGALAQTSDWIDVGSIYQG